MDTLTDYLSTARSAYRQHDWSATYTAFVRADEVGSMAIDDLDAFATTAWLLGHGREAARLAEHVYDRSARTDPAAAAMKAATLSMMWRSRGHEEIAADWAAKARRLLADAPISPVRGYLAYVGAVSAADRGDVEGVARELLAVDEIAADLDPAVPVLARVLRGVAALIDGRIDDGCRLVDGELLPVLSQDVPLEWGGDAYRLVLRVGARHGAGEHVRAWIESMGQWSDIVDSAAYRAIHQIHLIHWDGPPLDTRRAAVLRRDIADLDAAATALLDELQGGSAR
jgi:hypothetical protein